MQILCCDKYALLLILARCARIKLDWNIYAILHSVNAKKHMALKM